MKVVTAMAERALEPRHGVFVGAGRWTARRALAELPETNEMIIEVIDGSVVVSPRPSAPHQRALLRLAHLLDQSGRGSGLEAFTEINLVCGEDLTSPDITVIRYDADENRVWLPASDAVMVVEIVSPGSVHKDRFGHPAIYAREKIRHYMRVEAQHRSSVIFYHNLVNGEYRQIVKAPAATTFTMTDPFAFEIDPADLV